MQLENLSIENFRLLSDVRLAFEPGVNLLAGGNAQGKTTILEAISYLASGRSFRTQRDREVIPHDAPTDDPAFATIVEGTFAARSLRRSLRAVFSPAGKNIEAEGKTIDRLADLCGLLNVVVFIPSDLELVRGGPGERRALADSLLARTSRYDLQAMQHYAQALRERNAALRTAVPSNDQLGAYETVMAEHGARVLAARERLCTALAPHAARHLAALAGGSEQLEISHDPGLPQSTGIRKLLQQSEPDLGEIAARMADYWRLARDNDRQRGFTFGGPHRGDLALAINGEDVRAYASQGQTRSIVLALRLAEMEFFRERDGEPPVLLLDDVLGELDKRRLGHFLEQLQDPQLQSLITATDAHEIEEGLPVAAEWKVEAGAVERVR